MSLFVKDNGIGIEEEHHSKIFELFKRLHNKVEYLGPGAGLTICKKIVDKLHGSIRLESTVGKGTTFFIDLPDSIGREDAHNSGQFQPQVVSLN
jgi:light-regulated signal transduction histidine kinase (bacteriophytochrome)